MQTTARMKCDKFLRQISGQKRGTKILRSEVIKQAAQDQIGVTLANLDSVQSLQVSN